MKRIVIKEIDKLTSTLHKSRVITEYLIYLMDSEKIIEAYTEVGKAAKDTRVNELILCNFIFENFKDGEIDKEDIVEEITFKEYINKNTQNKTKTWKKKIIR